jgi:hypothetical protein
VAVSSVSQEIELYEIKKSKNGGTFHYCQKMLKFSPQGLEQDPKFFIECISAGKGYLTISYTGEYILFDLEAKKIQKRGKGKKKENQI